MPALSNAKHEQVAQLAAQGISATQAYLTVYADCSEEAARRNASRLLTKADVRARVQELSNKAAERAVVTAEMILRRAWEVANSDAKDRAQHLAIAARAFPEFKDGVTVDNRSINLTLPDGTSLDDLRRLREELKSE